MDTLQYDSFYKFLVSLGMLLITLPVLAFLYVLNMDCKLISQSDYDNLSQISIQRIQNNANLLDFTTTIMPVASIVLIITGLTLIIIGCCKWYSIQKELDELRALLTEKDAEIEKLKGENEKAKNESEEILKAAKIKSDYMVKNAEFFAFSTREKLLSAKKTIDAALSDIDKSISTTKEETEE